jgi:hypothetical protein
MIIRKSILQIGHPTKPVRVYFKKIIHLKPNKCQCHTICPKVDKNNLFDGLVLPLAHGWTIWYFSYIHFFTSLYAFYNNLYLLALFGFGSMATSLNYWRNPVKQSWRRNIDIAFIQLTFYVHIYYALYMSTRNGYIFFSSSGIICYYTSNYYINKNLFFATFYHILVHVFASIANAILYSGTIEHY